MTSRAERRSTIPPALRSVRRSAVCFVRPVARLTLSLVLIAFICVLFGDVMPARAAGAPVAPRAMIAVHADTARTTMDGVYTLQQAVKGKDVFAAYCITCHTPTVHSGPPFRSKWFGRPLSDLFSYIQRAMPKAAPGSMSDADYARALAYLLRINGMPAGTIPLAADSTTLHSIRLDSVRAGPTASGSRP